MRVEIARFQARKSAPTLVARMAGCTLCRRAVAIALPALGNPPCPYLAHPSTRSRSLPLILDGGTA